MWPCLHKQMAHRSAPVHHLPPKETRPKQKNLRCRGFSEIRAHAVLGRSYFCGRTPVDNHTAGLGPDLQGIERPMYAALFFREFEEWQSELGIGLHGDWSLGCRGAGNSSERGGVQNLDVENDRCSGVPCRSRVGIAEDGLPNGASYSNAHLPAIVRTLATPSRRSVSMCCFEG